MSYVAMQQRMRLQTLTILLFILVSSLPSLMAATEHQAAVPNALGKQTKKAFAGCIHDEGPKFFKAAS
jgi:hypothetical protein